MNRIQFPKDVKQYLLRIQAEKKIERNTGNFSIERAAIYVIRKQMKLEGVPTEEPTSEEFN
jgi:hypothetical protein